LRGDQRGHHKEGKLCRNQIAYSTNIEGGNTSEHYNSILFGSINTTRSHLIF